MRRFSQCVILKESKLLMDLNKETASRLWGQQFGIVKLGRERKDFGKGFLVYGGFKKTGHWNDLEWLRIHFSMFRGSVHVVGEGKEVY